ncbi:hypothetical protein [Noviherbaspirillum pedocola]|uniref:Uncharacterized protein n=1 Tax=Noviherbaspirillum pedocola TaxID=2801341 RepID=A0A934SZY7_9BURK|nr:hypothetical protein [Noviherbaspirillum pedocola]MBK4738799.1 hypothetical protein [Noviherbaspirillum pedocola]
MKNAKSDGSYASDSENASETLRARIRFHLHQNFDIQHIAKAADNCRHVSAGWITPFAQHAVQALAADTGASTQFLESNRQIDQIPEKHAGGRFINFILAPIMQIQRALEYGNRIEWIKDLRIGLYFA